MNSRDKGCRGEREFSNLCKAEGYETRRSQQYCGVAGDADVIGLPFLHVEVKRVEPKHFSIGKFMQQAIDEAKEGLIPVVAHRFNNCEWLITMRIDDFTEVATEWLVGVDEDFNEIQVSKERFNIYDEFAGQPRFTAISYFKGDTELITMRFSEWIELYREWEAGRVDNRLDKS